MFGFAEGLLLSLVALVVGALLLWGIVKLLNMLVSAIFFPK